MDLSAAMRRCLSLAALAEGRTAPNPMVGCVILSRGAIVAEGFHHAPGQPHAEREALAALRGPLADDAVLVVNLEPCNHHGRTPPCVDAILEVGIRHVVAGMVDPDPRVAGRGIARLRAAGVHVEVGVEEEACQRLNRAYVLARTVARPMFTLKVGITLDGCIADGVGTSQWITSPDARAAGHALRDRHDAVLVGRGTLASDDPALTTRLVEGRDARPVVLDTNLRIAASARVLRSSARALVFCGPRAPRRQDLDAEVVVVDEGPHGLDLAAVATALWERDLHAVLVEGGARVHRAFLEAGLADRGVFFVAPKAVGHGQGWLGGNPRPLADAALPWRFVRAESHGPDVALHYETPIATR